MAPEGAMPAHAAEPDVDLSENRLLAQRLDEFAALLEQQDDGGFRIRAYREAAEEILRMTVPVRGVFEREGVAGLIALPKIGRGIAAALAEMMTSGRWSQLDRLRGEATAAHLFMTIPGIGPKLAQQLADEAEIETLEELEIALQPGQPPIAGFGPRRRRAVLAVLAERLGRLRTARRTDLALEPPVAMLLEADAIYRAGAAAGRLRQIAPRRFNPTGAAWLPILHARRDDWHLTLMWSNTARAHALGKTGDWVVVYFHKEGQPEGRRTIVTESRGPQVGTRVVRGREAECAQLVAVAQPVG